VRILDSVTVQGVNNSSRLRSLQGLGVFCGFTAGAWLGAAEAPTKLVSIGISPVLISLMMVLGLFTARWSLQALTLGTPYIRADVRQVPHLVIWAVLAGCMEVVANTLTIFAIPDIGLSIAFALWNTNSLLGIFWGVLFFHELRQAGWRRWLGVVGGALVMFAAAVLLAVASSTQAAPGHALRGVVAALGAAVLWGTEYIPWRKAYVTGMNPFSFVTFFTFGELAMMTTLAVALTGGVAPLWREMASAKHVLFWLMLGGFIWVVGDLLQQYATKYVGISRGIPLSNTNHLWGLLWGVLVFGELHGGGATVYAEVIGGSLSMALGAGAIALSCATEQEHLHWEEMAKREGTRYRVDPAYVAARMRGEEASNEQHRRSWVDWAVGGCATAIFVVLAAITQVPPMNLRWGWVVSLAVASLALLAGGGRALWRTTRFN
jgi:drug/metabolite transporter (DMT)-like permease